MKKIHSMSGQEIANVSHKDRVLCALADTAARPLMSNDAGDKVIGPENAVLIVQELERHGYEVRPIIGAR